jgi:hypothetical protein
MLSMGFRPLTVVALIVALVAGVSSAFAAHGPSATRSTNTIVSQGAGRQVLEGAGLTYGTLLPGGSVRLVDLSPKHDAKYTVTAQLPATATAAAQSIGIKPAKAGSQLTFRFNKSPRLKASLAFSVAGSKFRLVLDGNSVLNGAAVIGKITLEGTGTIAVNGQNPPADWLTAGRITLTAHTAAPPKPTTTATTTTTTTTTTATTS